MSRFGGVAHLARRFVWSLRPPPADPDATRRLRDAMSPAERGLYDRLGEADRRHAVAGVAKVVDLLGDAASDDVVVAAALHDVGKIAAGLGTAGRVAATVAASLAGDERTTRWAALPDDDAGVARTLDDVPASWRVRVGRYAHHPRIGAAALRRAGSARLAVDWAAGHHETGGFGLDSAVAEALLAADEA